MDIADRITAQLTYLHTTFPGKNLKYVSEAYVHKLFDDLWAEALADLKKSIESIEWLKTECHIDNVRVNATKVFYGRLYKVVAAIQPLAGLYSFAPAPKKKADLNINDYVGYLLTHAA